MLIFELIEAYAAARLVDRPRGDATYRSLKSLLDPVAQEPVDALTLTLIEDLLRLKTRTAPIHAERALGYLNPMLAWAVELDHLQAYPLYGRPRPSPRPPRDRILSLEDLRRIWRSAGALAYPFGLAMQLLVLVPATREVIGGMRLTDLMAAPAGGLIWRIPGEVTWPHRLSGEAAEVIRSALERRQAGSDFIFSTTGSTPISGWSKAKRRLDDLMAGEGADSAIDPWRLNDLRASFAAIGRDACGFDRWVSERCLGRVSAFNSPLLREWAASPELQIEADAALATWAAMIRGDD